MLHLAKPCYWSNLRRHFWRSVANKKTLKQGEKKEESEEEQDVKGEMHERLSKVSKTVEYVSAKFGGGEIEYNLEKMGNRLQNT